MSVYSYRSLLAGITDGQYFQSLGDLPAAIGANNSRVGVVGPAGGRIVMDGSKTNPPFTRQCQYLAFTAKPRQYHLVLLEEFRVFRQVPILAGNIPTDRQVQLVWNCRVGSSFSGNSARVQKADAFLFKPGNLRKIRAFIERVQIQIRGKSVPLDCKTTPLCKRQAGWVITGGLN